jgi:hypothetical protein
MEAAKWLMEDSRGTEADIFLKFSSISRRFPKQKLQMTEEDVQERNKIKPGWTKKLSLDPAARVLYLLSLAAKFDAAQFDNILRKLFETADVNELQVLHATIPLI